MGGSPSVQSFSDGYSGVEQFFEVCGDFPEAVCSYVLADMQTAVPNFSRFSRVVGRAAGTAVDSGGYTPSALT